MKDSPVSLARSFDMSPPVLGLGNNPAVVSSPLFPWLPPSWQLPNSPAAWSRPDSFFISVPVWTPAGPVPRQVQAPSLLPVYSALELASTVLTSTGNNHNQRNKTHLPDRTGNNNLGKSKYISEVIIILLCEVAL